MTNSSNFPYGYSHARSFSLGLVIALASLADSAVAAVALPAPPLLKRDVHLVDQGRLTRPAIPANRTTNDGRISLDFSSVTQVEFTLLKPEAIEQPFDRSPNGYAIIGGDDVAPFNVDRDLFHDSTFTGFGSASHHTICEDTPSKAAVSGSKKNPYSCDGDPAADCYDLTMISTNKLNGGSQVELWGTPFTVKVKSPKTKFAYIESVSVGTPVRGATHTGIKTWFEPITTGDGRLFLGRTGFRNVFYSVAAESEPACDVTTWTDRHELTHAYHDPAMRVGGTMDGDARYGIAAYPLKDGAGNLIPDNAPLKLTYPWIDKAGDNVFFTSVDATLFYNHSGSVSSRYPAECYISGTGCIANPTAARAFRDVDTGPALRGIGVIGAWTHGKALLVDNLLNNIDYGTGWGDNQQYNITLYSGGGADSKVRIGGAGNIGNPFPSPGGLPLASTNPYVYIIDSVENLFNDIPNMVPSTIRDTVWYVNMGKVTDKVVFDEYLSHNVLVFSEWIPVLVHTDTSGATRPRYQMHYRDGFVSSAAESIHGSGFGEDVWFQNGASGLHWNVAPYGLAHQAEANEPIRAEPVAQGGIHGRGLWLFEKNRVTYDIPAQTDKNIDHYPLYIGLFIDPAQNDSFDRRLLTFPDGSFISLKGRATVSIGTGTSAVAHFTLDDESPDTRKWRHIGFKVENGGASVEYFLDGYKKDHWLAANENEQEFRDKRLFRMTSGTLTLGRPSDAESHHVGFEGWTDDLLIAAHGVGPELACNYANGTLVGLQSGYTGNLTTQAGRYPTSSHLEISNHLTLYGKTAYAKYACLHDYTSDLDMDTRQIPTGTASVREDLNFPEGPLRAGVARPNTINNLFCQSCHSDENSHRPLKLAALSNNGVVAERDTRRQPFQGPRLVYGNLPANHFALNVPPADTVADASGTVSDSSTLTSGLAPVSPSGDNDGDGVTNANDPFPNDSGKKADLDGDRIADSIDTDKDGDGVANTEDAFPLDPYEWVDADADGTGDNADVDSNNDGIMDPIRATFDQLNLQETTRKLLNAEWELIDPRQAGYGDHYAGGYTIKRAWGRDGETGIRHAMLQGGFDASAKFTQVGDNRGGTVTQWKFLDSTSAMIVEFHSIHQGRATLVAAIRQPGADRLTSFGSRVVAKRADYRIDVKWEPSSSGGPGSGTWTVKAGVNGEEPTPLGITTVTTAQGVGDARSMEFAIRGAGVEYILLDELTLTPDGDLGHLRTPGITVSPSELTISEGGSSSYTVVLNKRPTTSVTVTISKSARTSSVVTVTPQTIGFTTENWNTPRMVTVTAEADDDVFDEVATFIHTARGGEYTSLSAAATVTVHDSIRDGVPAGSVGVSVSPQASAAGTAEGGVAQFSITVPEGSAPSADLSVPWHVLPVGAAESPYQCISDGPIGAASSDFGDGESPYPSGTAVIAAGANSTEVELAIRNDNSPEGVETYRVILDTPKPGTGDNANYSVAAAAIGSIEANDPGVSVGWRASNLVPEGESALYQICALPVPANDLTVNWSVGPGRHAPAASANDFGNADNSAALSSFPSGAVTILAGQSSATVSVPVFEDDLLGDASRGERRESFALSLTDIATPSGATEYGFHPLFGNSASDGYIRAEGRADAGDDQTVLVGAVVTLDGSRSHDALDEGDDSWIDYVWEQVASDGGSTLATDGMSLSGTGSVRTFTAPTQPATLHFRLTAKDSANGRPENGYVVETHYDWVTVRVLSDSEARIENGSFESTGSVTFAPNLRSADNWIFTGAASAVGALANPDSFGFPAAAHGSNVLYLGVDFVDGRSTSGGAHQDLGRTAEGRTYTVTAVVSSDSRWPAGHKISLRDAVTDAELASSTNVGSVSISYTETEARTLRLQVETNGAVADRSALRTSVDNIALTVLDPSEARIENGSFESTGSVTFAPNLRSADNWIFTGAASAVGALANPDSFGFPAAAHGSNVLYLGVDFVDGRSTSGGAHQDLGRTAEGRTYTVTAVVSSDSRWPAGHKISLRDAVTDAELASSTNVGSVSIAYTETEARTLRLQVETNGAVADRSALRTSVDNVVLTVSP